VHRLSHRNWAVPSPLTQMVNKGGGSKGDYGVLSQKTWRDGGAKILKEAFLKMLLKALIWVLYQKKIEKDLF
jgi:hypothetical protein